MMQLLVIKEQMKEFYQRASIYVNPVAKFIMALAVFMMINQQLGFNMKLNGLPILLILSTFCAFTPSVILVVLSMVFSVGHIFALSKILAALVLIIFLIIYCLFSKATSYFGQVILAVSILFFLNIPYCVPILLGLIATPLAIVPVACGVSVHFLMNVVRGLSNSTLGMSVEDILNILRSVLDGWLRDKNMFFTIAVFCAVVIVVYVIRKQEFNYAFEISIAAGAITNILGFLIGDIGFGIEVNLLTMVLGSLGSMLIAYVVWFFRPTLDHTAIERMQYEDDDYYYYVKAVPKIKMTAPKKNIKKINEKKDEGSYGESDSKKEDLQMGAG